MTNFFALDPTIDFVVEAALARLGELRSKTKHQLRSTIDKIFSGKLRDFRRFDNHVVTFLFYFLELFIIDYNFSF